MTIHRSAPPLLAPTLAVVLCLAAGATTGCSRRDAAESPGNGGVSEVAPGPEEVKGEPETYAPGEQDRARGTGADELSLTPREGARSAPRDVGRDRTAEDRTARDQTPGTATTSAEERHPEEPAELDAPTDAEEGGEDVDEGTSRLLFVIQDPLGEALPGVRVSLQSDRGSWERLTSDRGEAFFARLRAGAYSYVLAAPGRATLTSASPVPLAEGEERVLALRLGASDLSISGRVLNQRGEPLGGIEVVAVRTATARSAEELVPTSRREHRTLTSERGWYEVGGLEQGAYQVRAVVGEGLPSATIVVQAGVDSADLIVPVGREIRLYGTVTDTYGSALEGAHVRALGQPGGSATTDGRGDYEVYLTRVTEGRNPTVQFTLAGYHTIYLVPETVGLRGGGQIRLDAQLEPEGEKVEVSGRVRSTYGDPVPRETVRLYAPSLKRQYLATSGEDGLFTVANVEIATDYQLSVRPNGSYQDYMEGPIALNSSGIFLDVRLEPLAGGSLTGRMVDLDGRPIPGFQLWLSSDRSRTRFRPVASDQDGYFFIEDAPEGRLVLETRAAPQLRVSGAQLQPGEDADLLLLLDWGDLDLSGRIVDDRGGPVGGAQVLLTWMHRGPALSSTSNRRTVSDQNGLFRFTQLGPGVHHLDVRSPGFGAFRRSVDVGRDVGFVDVVLQPSP